MDKPHPWNPWRLPRGAGRTVAAQDCIRFWRTHLFRAHFSCADSIHGDTRVILFKTTKIQEKVAGRRRAPYGVTVPTTVLKLLIRWSCSVSFAPAVRNGPKEAKHPPKRARGGPKRHERNERSALGHLIYIYIYIFIFIFIYCVYIYIYIYSGLCLPSLPRTRQQNMFCLFLAVFLYCSYLCYRVLLFYSFGKYVFVVYLLHYFYVLSISYFLFERGHNIYFAWVTQDTTYRAMIRCEDPEQYHTGQRGKPLTVSTHHWQHVHVRPEEHASKTT